jgi:hypothetical protein
MTRTVVRNALIRLAHPVDDPLEGQAAERLAAQFECAVWTPDLSRGEASGHAAKMREMPLAELLAIVHDASQELAVRFDAARAALAAKDRESLTVNVVSYADAQVPFWRPDYPTRMVH